MKYCQSTSYNPAYNLALEEFLFNKVEEDYLLIYRNENAVVCGKHQNPVAEINSRYLLENNIPLIRRFSGGGTVFHDLGNINFSFITTGVNTKVIDFAKFAKPVIDFLKTIGLQATLSDRNDILLNGKKITGHAAHSKNTRALHHGTILFNADLSVLSASLKSNKDKFKSRAVKSVRSTVTNICDEISADQSIEAFILSLSNYLSDAFLIDEKVDLSESDHDQIVKLEKAKYNDWDWNYAYGPSYSFEVHEKINEGIISAEIEVVKGRISNISFRESSTFETVFNNLIGIRHDLGEINKKLLEELDEKTAVIITNLLF